MSVFLCLPVLTQTLCFRLLQVLFSRYCPLLDTGLTLGMRLLYTSVTWCYGETARAAGQQPALLTCFAAYCSTCLYWALYRVAACILSPVGHI